MGLPSGGWTSRRLKSLSRLSEARRTDTHTHTHTLPALSLPSGYLLRAPFGLKANYLNATGSRSRIENPRNWGKSPETSTRHGPPLEVSNQVN